MSNTATKARLVLADGSEYTGRVFGAPVSTAGEVVFATGMVGYPESMTDPSYRDQILVLTYPLIGNYGVPAREIRDRLPVGFEADRIQIRALVVSSVSSDSSHWNAASSLEAWMVEEGITGIMGIDTRALTRHLREGGTVPGKVLVDGDPAGSVTDASPFEDISTRNLVAEVSVPEPVLYGDGRRRVIVVDCGAKAGIIRSLLARGVSVLRVPWDHDFNDEDADGILISNGPGDPVQAGITVENIRKALSG